MPPAQPQPARRPQWPPRAAPKAKPPAALRRPADAPPGDDEARYPDLGVPAMTTDHREALADSTSSLETRYADRDDVFVASNLTIHFVDGSEERAIQPDVFVSFGSPKGRRRVWLAWEEGTLPDFVLEVASKSTYRRDEREKRAIYERMGVAEYWQFDPTGDYLKPAPARPPPERRRRLRVPAPGNHLRPACSTACRTCSACTSARTAAACAFTTPPPTSSFSRTRKRTSPSPQNAAPAKPPKPNSKNSSASSPAVPDPRPRRAGGPLEGRHSAFPSAARRFS